MNNNELDDKHKESKNSNDNEVNTTSNITKIDLNIPNLTRLVCLKKEGVPFKKDDRIIKYFTNDSKEPNPKYIKSPIFGWILKYDSDDKKLILESCPHDTFYVNLCLKCGFKKTEEYENQAKSYGFLASDFSYSLKRAESLEKSVVNNYLNNQKLILFLDLDNTIIHTSPIKIVQDDINKLQETYKEYFAKVPIKNEFKRTDTILVKFRPFLKTFLKNIKNKYEIYIYTQGTKEYATGIIQYVNSNFESDSLSTERMMHRILDENGFATNKSIKKVFPTQENMILILDDHIEVWKESKESGDNFICIYPYKFFTEKDKFMNQLGAPNGEKTNKEKYLKYDYDNVLFCITNLLLSVHRKFFDFYNKFKFQKNIQRITKEMLWAIFHGKKFYYHLNYYNCPVKKNKKSKEKKNNEKKEKSETINNNQEKKMDIDQEEKEDKENKEIKEVKENKENKENKEDKEDKENNEVKEKKEDKENEEAKDGNDKKLENKDNFEEKELSNNYKDKENNKIKEDNNKEEKKKVEEVKRNLDEEKYVINTLKYKIEKLGGELIEEEKDMFNAEIFMTDFYDEKDPVIKKIEEHNSNENNKKIPILHCHYIEICLMYFFEVCIDDFELSQKVKMLKVLNLNQIFMKNKANIINFYGNNKDFIDEN